MNSLHEVLKRLRSNVPTYLDSPNRKLAADARGQAMIAAIGLEALVALRRAGITPAYFYGVTGAVIEAAQAGLNPFVACVADQVTALAQRLEKENLNYQIVEYHA